MDLHSLRAFIFDMDGVIYKGDQVIPGVVEFLDFLRQRNFPFQFVTNNSTRTPQAVAARLARMGILSDAAHILTSSLGAALYLKKIRPDGASVYVIGEDGLRLPLIDAGFAVADEGAAEFVVLGMDRKLTYDKLRRATLLIRAGASFIATNPDTTFPTPEGLVPGAGALIAAVTSATGVRPLVIGKPEPACFEIALEKMGTRAGETAAIGDRLDTDIDGGQRAGLPTILVLTGVTTRNDVDSAVIKPTWVFEDLSELRSALGG
jgi:HAD superfamily hydrolase (TIGR01457 family)